MIFIYFRGMKQRKHGIVARLVVESKLKTELFVSDKNPIQAIRFTFFWGNSTISFSQIEVSVLIRLEVHAASFDNNAYRLV